MVPRAKTAFPMLVNELTNTDSSLLDTITKALIRIDPDAAAKVFVDRATAAK
jgi:hypothetical protein